MYRRLPACLVAVTLLAAIVTPMVAATEGQRPFIDRSAPAPGGTQLLPGDAPLADQASTSTVLAVGAGSGHTCVVLNDGTVACWGDNWGGEASPPAGTFTTVDPGADHTCAIRADRTLACWGWDGDGRATPPGGTFAALSTGGNYACGLRTDGTLACWGANPWGQTTAPAGTFTAVGAGNAHACAVKNDGSVTCWGFNSYGDTEPPAGSFTSVEAGAEHTCAIRLDGTIACWGRDFEGQATPPGGTFTSLSVQESHSCAIRTDGTLACWGSDYFGQATPPSGTYTALSAGTSYVCAVRTDGALACWGSTWSGQQDTVVTPATVDFGTVRRRVADSPEDVSLTNLSTAAATVSAVALTGAAAADFSIANDGCTGVTLQALESCAVTVGFRPSANGLRSAALTLSGASPVGTRTVSLTGTGYEDPSGISWSATYKAGPAYTGTGGNALGRTVQSGTQRLHLAYATSRIGSRWAKDTGPYAGVYYVRSTSGSAWSSPKRLNPSTQHATRLGLAAAGSRVYVAWVRQTKIIRYSPTAPRVLYVRVNTRHGASTAWKRAVRLTSTSGRVDYPTVAASGSDVYVAYTDAVTGSVKVAVSRDRGATWTKKTVGSTTHSAKDGKAAWPSVAVYGSTVAVAWIGDGTGLVRTAVSVNRGATWTSQDNVGTQSNGGLSTAVRGARIAVAWTTDDNVVLRQRTDGVWGDPVIAGSYAPSENGRGSAYVYAPAVSLQDPNRIAVAWSEYLDGYDGRADLRWSESADGGMTWFIADTLGVAAATSTRRLNDWASVLWPSTGTRLVVWNGWTPESSSFRQYLRSGRGTPVGPGVVASVWQPAADGPGVDVRKALTTSPRTTTP